MCVCVCAETLCLGPQANTIHWNQWRGGMQRTFSAQCSMPHAFANPTLPWELVPLGICIRSSSISRDRTWICRWPWPFADLGAIVTNRTQYLHYWDATHFHGADLIPLFCSPSRDCPNILRDDQRRLWDNIKKTMTETVERLDNPSLLWHLPAF